METNKMLICTFVMACSFAVFAFASQSYETSTSTSTDTSTGTSSSNRSNLRDPSLSATKGRSIHYRNARVAMPKTRTHPRGKKWSLYLLPQPPYGRYPALWPANGNPYPPYQRPHPQYFLDRGTEPSEDFQFFYY